MKNKIKRSFSIEGYLRENTLKVEVNEKGEYIRGKLTISTSKDEAHTVDYWVNHFKKDGTENKAWTNMSALIGAQTTASIFEANPQATYESAIASAAKVWASGELEEYVSVGQNNQDVSYLTLKGSNAGVSNKVEGFDPHARFELDCFIKSEMAPEIKDEEETGRGLLNIVTVNDYNKCAHCFQLVVPTNFVSNIAEFPVNSTVLLRGQIINLAKKTIIKADTRNSFGDAGKDQITTEFVHELLITGGNSNYLTEEEHPDTAFALADIREAMKNREEVRAKNAAKKAVSMASSKPTPASPAPKKDWGASFGSAPAKDASVADDFDF